MTLQGTPRFFRNVVITLLWVGAAATSFSQASLVETSSVQGKAVASKILAAANRGESQDVIVVFDDIQIIDSGIEIIHGKSDVVKINTELDAANVPREEQVLRKKSFRAAGKKLIFDNIKCIY